MTTPIQHPAWCDRARCTISGEPGAGAHVGRPITVTAGEVLISVHLNQGASHPRYPDFDVVLVMVMVDDVNGAEAGGGWPMRLGPARELGAVLRAMVRAESAQ